MCTSPSLSLSLSVLGRIEGGTLIRFSVVQLVGDTAVLECNTSGLVTTSRDFTFQWSNLAGGSLPEKARFTQNRQTLILSNLTFEDNQQYRCVISPVGTDELFAVIYTLNVFGKPSSMLKDAVVNMQLHSFKNSITKLLYCMNVQAM